MELKFKKNKINISNSCTNINFLVILHNEEQDIV